MASDMDVMVAIPAAKFPVNRSSSTKSLISFPKGSFHTRSSLKVKSKEKKIPPGGTAQFRQGGGLCVLGS